MLKEAFDECFKFKIGDVLVHKSIADIPRTKTTWLTQGNLDARMFVVERIAQECPGGIQKQYRVRGVSVDGRWNAEFNLLNEIELAPLPSEPKEE